MFDPAKLGEEADTMIAALNQQKADTAPEAENQQLDGRAEAIAQPADTPAPEPQPIDDQGVDSARAEPDLSGQLAELKKQADAADQRWRVLQGMIDKKDEEISSLRLLLGQLSSKQGTEKPAEPTGPLVTAEDINEYGSSFLDMIGRKAEEVFLRLMTPYQQRIEQLSGSLNTVATTSVKSAQQQFEAALSTAVPKWRQINVDPQFLAWLEVPAPFTKAKKLDLLRQAYQELDSEKVIEFFTSYEAETQAGQQTQQAQQPNAAAHAAPGRSRAPAAARTENTGEGRVWTRAAIAKLYDDKANRKISQKEFDELERDIFRAQRENRIAA